MNPGSATFRRIANVAPVLVSTLSFLRMFSTCFSTVRRLAETIAEISQSRLPCILYHPVQNLTFALCESELL